MCRKRAGCIVLFGPVDAPCRTIVGIYGDVVEDGVLSQDETVLPADVERVFGHEGHVASVVVLRIAHHIVGEGSVGVAIASVQEEIIGSGGHATMLPLRCFGFSRH